MSREDIPEPPLFQRATLERPVLLSMRELSTLHHPLPALLHARIADMVEGKCAPEGFVRAGSTRLESHTAGRLVEGHLVQYHCVFTADVCLPLENTALVCRATNVTKVGVRARCLDDACPIVVHIVREMHRGDPAVLDAVQVGDEMRVVLRGVRVELNSTDIQTVAEWLGPSAPKEGLEDLEGARGSSAQL